MSIICFLSVKFTLLLSSYAGFLFCSFRRNARKNRHERHIRFQNLSRITEKIELQMNCQRYSQEF